ncbi:MAG: SDR family NAD(P)-dependent oxidoreductase [Pseudomonadota bacterium]
MSRIVQSFCLFLIVSTLTLSPRNAYADHAPHVLVTGATTGIGRHLAETLASDGYHVYAGARTDDEMAELNALDNITAVRLDVTKQDEIDAAVAMIEEQGTGLYALVNNAGVGGGGPIASTPIEDQRFVYDVNVEGVYRITKAFAPLIIESKGRIVTTGSIAGTLAWAGGSAYSGSKHWIEALTDSLAAEMAPLGVSVSVVEPGNFQSYIRRSSVLRQFAKVEAAGGEITDEMKQMYAQTEKRELSYRLPVPVSEAFMHALFDDKPLRRYVVTPNADEQARTIMTKIEQLVQLNEWGPHSYSRDELYEMLRQAMSEDKVEE